jgi:hypothetical protein
MHPVAYRSAAVCEILNNTDHSSYSVSVERTLRRDVPSDYNDRMIMSQSECTAALNNTYVYMVQRLLYSTVIGDYSIGETRCMTGSCGSISATVIDDQSAGE